MKLLKERVYKAFNETNAVQRYFSKKASRLLEPLGFHVVGDHFYEPIPNISHLQESYQDEPRKCLKIDFDFENAEKVITQSIARWGKDFYYSVQRFGYQESNYYFRGVDALYLYCFLRERQPKSIIEIGQGFSTSVIVAALEDNYAKTGVKTRFVSIDPYNRFRFQDGNLLGVELESIATNLQEIPLSFFNQLEEDNLLFVDSSHVYKFGSDVEYLFEEIYPSLGMGVELHIHDIFSPYHYPLDWYVKERKFWNEQYYLENFLRFQDVFQVVMPIYYLTRNSQALQEKCSKICDYDNFKLTGSSFYLKKTG